MSKASKNTSRRKLFTVGSDAPFQFVEAYKSLRTNLEFLSSAGNCKTILITSSVPEEGKTNVAVNLTCARRRSPAICAFRATMPV